MGRGAVARQGERKGDFLAGKYLLEDCLGIGGMGEVYRATNVSLGRKVAIKLLSPEYVNIEEDVLRFLREARAAAAVRHANVVDVLDVARDDDGTPFIVQELLAGEDLERYLKSRGGRLSCEETLEIMIPVADAVAAAHAHDVVHRDLKPANIFLARERNKIVPKVLDFGACLFPTIAARSAKEVRMLIGTPHYMAPEQIVSKADVDARSDVWSLGIILYEMLVGETPFEAESANAVLQLVKTQEVPPLRERCKTAPVELERLIARCTNRDRMARLANAGELHASMEEVRRKMKGVADERPTVGELSSDAAAAIAKVTSSGAATASARKSDPEARVGKLPEPPSLPSLEGPKKSALLTLSSPGSEPPPAPDFDLDLPLQAPTPESRLGSSKPPKGTVEAPTLARHQFVDNNIPVREMFDSADGSLDLAARPSSWPPPPERAAQRAAVKKSSSSIPPVLDPRAAAPSSRPSAARPPQKSRDEIQPATSDPSAAKPAARPPSPSRDFGVQQPKERPPWTRADTIKFVAAVALPAVVGFIVVLAVPVLAGPLGRALRGDSVFASGVLAVVSLVCAAAVCARAMLGERDRWMYVASVGVVLFGIFMIIVTFSASEAVETGVPAGMGSVSTLFAPIAPLALALRALGVLRETWVARYSRSENIRLASMAAFMLFLTLVLSPAGAVQIQSRPVAPHGSSTGGSPATGSAPANGTN